MADLKNNPIDYCYRVSRKGQRAEGYLSCECGCDRFFLFKRKDTADEVLENEAASRRLHDDFWPFGPVIAKDKNGVTVARKEFLWFKWGERPLTDYLPSVIGFQYVVAKCEKCGKEIVLFDGRSHLPLTGEATKYGQIGVIKWDKNASPLECVVDFVEGGNDEFGRLRIYKIAGGKKKLCFDHEV